MSSVTRPPGLRNWQHTLSGLSCRPEPTRNGRADQEWRHWAHSSMASDHRDLGLGDRMLARLDATAQRHKQIMIIARAERHYHVPSLERVPMCL